MAAKCTPVRQENPVDGFLDGITEANAPEIDRSAIWTAGGEHRFTVASFLELSKKGQLECGQLDLPLASKVRRVRRPAFASPAARILSHRSRRFSSQEIECYPKREQDENNSFLIFVLFVRPLPSRSLPFLTQARQSSSLTAGGSSATVYMSSSFCHPILFVVAVADRPGCYA